MLSAQPTEILGTKLKLPRQRALGLGSGRVLGRISLAQARAPNPFTDACTVTINHKGERDETVLSMVDMTGTVVLQQPLLLYKGENTFYISAFKSLPVGTYALSVLSNGQLLTTRVIKN